MSPIFGRRRPAPKVRRTISGKVVEDGRRIFWRREDSFPGQYREARRAHNKRARLSRRGKPQTLPGITAAQRSKRHRHLENVAARANTVQRTRFAAEDGAA